MVEKKDTHIDLYNKGHSQKIGVLDDAPSAHNPFFLYALRKAERIASAIYLLTRAADSDDPVINALREDSVSLVSYAASLALVPGGGRGRVANSIQAILFEIPAKLSIAASAGYIGDGNREILSHECLGLADGLVENAHAGGVLKKSYLDASEPYIGHGEARGLIKDRTVSSRSMAIKDSASRTVTQGGAERHGERRETILKLVREKGTVSVRDFVTSIPSVSAKTIQRELLSLVADGSLKKEGERRWSRYTLP